MNQITLTQYNAILDTIYSAPLNDDWQPVIEMLSSSMGSIHTHMFGHDIALNKQLSLSGIMYDPAMLDTYNIHYHEKNPWIPGVARSAVGKASSSESYCPTEVLTKTEFFNDWIRPQEEIGGGGGIVLFNDGNRFIMLGGNIRFRDRDEKEREWVELLDLLAPHFRRAFRAWRALSEVKFLSQGYRDALDHVGSAIFLLSRVGYVCHQNGQADTLLQSGKLFRIDPSRRLGTFDPVANETIRQTLAAIQSGDISSLPEVFAVREKGGGTPHFATLLPLPANSERSGILYGILGEQIPVAMLIMRNPAKDRRPAAQILASLYGLTPAESALARALSEGHSLKSYAEVNSVTIYTVRNQLQAVFGKTGTGRQTDLIALLARFGPL